MTLRTPRAVDALSPLPRGLQLVPGCSVAGAVLGALDAGIRVVMAEAPQLVRADGLAAAWADHQLTAFDPELKLPTTTEVARPVELALLTVAGQPLPSFLMSLGFSAAIARITTHRPDGG